MSDIPSNVIPFSPEENYFHCPCGMHGFVEVFATLYPLIFKCPRCDSTHQTMSRARRAPKGYAPPPSVDDIRKTQGDHGIEAGKTIKIRP